MSPSASCRSTERHASRWKRLIDIADSAVHDGTILPRVAGRVRGPDEEGEPVTLPAWAPRCPTDYPKGYN